HRGPGQPRGQTDVDQDDVPCPFGGGVHEQTGLVRAEGDGDIGAYGMPDTSPVSASIPLGRSTAITGAGAPAAAAASVAYDSRRPPRPPIPSSPSTIRSAPNRSVSSSSDSVKARTRPPAARSAAAPSSCRRDPAVSAHTTAPRAARDAPAYRASPPLSPLPTMSTTREP